MNFTNNLNVEDYKKIKELDKKLESNPNDLNLLMKKAYIYANGYDDENVIKIYEHIIQLDPNYVEAYFWLSYYYYQIGFLSEAIEVAQKGLKIDPKRADLYLIIAWANSFEAGDKKEFLFNVKKVIELEPSWLTPRIALIYFLIHNNDHQEAKKEIAEALKKVKDYAVPKDEVERRYEYYVTGRTSESTKKTLNEFY